MKLVREYINEKFKEESDPIKDMDIGMMHKIKEFVKKLTKSDYVDIDTCLLYCAKQNKEDYVKYLIENGADINAYRGSVIEWVVLNKNLELAKWLIEKGANLHLSIHYGILNTAKSNEDEDMIKLLKDNGAEEFTSRQLAKKLKAHGRELYKINKEM